MAAGKEFTQTLRVGFAATCELAAISALGVSLAALMWSVATPKGAVQNDTLGGRGETPTTHVQIVTRLSRIADPFTTERAVTASVTSASGFTLHATRATGDGEGTAILAPSGGQQGAFAVGEEVTPGVVLAAVASDYVEIDVGGQRMRVAFPGSRPREAMEFATNLPADYNASARAAPPLASLPLQPINRNGNSGFEVMPQADGGVLSAAGLRPGDVILSVNGAAAANADLSAYRAQIEAGQPVEIRYERDGQIHTTRLGIQ